MDRINSDELKIIQLQILEYVAKFCDENEIDYFLDCGTLLGAIRHKGYIPWDDDIDIGMLRPSYDKFLATFNKSNSRYKSYSIENNDTFFSPHAKVLDTETILYEPDEKGRKLSVNIDVFVYDNAPDDDKKVKEMFSKRDFYRNLNVLRTLNNRPKGSLLRRLLIYALRMIVRPFKQNFFCLKMVELSKLYSDKKTKRVGNFTSYSRTVCDRSVFDKYTTVEFEGKLFKAPQGYDAWLHSFYGDYMQLPPPEKRVSHHSFIAYKK